MNPYLTVIFIISLAVIILGGILNPQLCGLFALLFGIAIVFYCLVRYEGKRKE